MTPSNNFPQFVEAWEGLRLKAYQDVRGVWTIGFGTTVYKDGSKVKPGDVITREQAYDYLMSHVGGDVAEIMKDTTGETLTQNQIDALCDFVYNEGTTAFRDSTLLKLIRANPNDPAIRDEFMKWDKVRDQHTGQLVVSDWQVKRRRAEADLYFSNT